MYAGIRDFQGEIKLYFMIAYSIESVLVLRV